MDATRENMMRRQRMLVIRERSNLIRTLWTTHLIQNSIDSLVPSSADVLQHNPIKSLVYSPHDVDVTGILTLTLENFKQSANAWICGQLCSLLARVGRSHLTGYIGDRLHLAAFVLQCSDPVLLHGSDSMEDETSKSTAMWYPEFLHHGCNGYVRSPAFRSTSPIYDIEVDDYDMRRSNVHPGYCRSPWHSDHLEFYY